MSKQIELRKVCKGERFILDGVEFVKLDDDATASFVLTADTLPDYCAFEDSGATRKDCNNFVGSLIQTRITRWLHEDHQAISRALIERPIDLTSMDGMTDYRIPFTFARILTSDEYRKYRSHIPLTDKPYWLATPWCTPSSARNSAIYAYYVYADGSLNSGDVYYANYYCPRPALYLKSSLLVSVETDDEEKSLRDYTNTELIDELYRRRNRCYSVCENMGFAIFGCCNADEKPSEFCKTQCKHYVDTQKEGSNADN